MSRDGAAPREWLPLDPDVDVDEEARHRPGAPQDDAARPRWPRFHPATLAVVAAGGCIGGLVRYVVGRHWPAPPAAVPWATLGVNLAGALVLGAVVAVAARASTPRWLRPLLGTGFCGALTTFSSVVVALDELVAHGHAATAAYYLALTVGGAAIAVTVGYAGAHTAVTRTADGRAEATEPTA